MTHSEDAKMLIHKMAHDELSMTSRLGYVALGLVAAAVTSVILSLWMTEPGDPARLQWAFAVPFMLGICWIGLATWALTTGRPLAARDRVIAGWMAVSFTSLILALMVLTALISRRIGGLYPVAVGLVLLGYAVRVLRRAQRRFTSLRARRAELERELG